MNKIINKEKPTVPRKHNTPMGLEVDPILTLAKVVLNSQWYKKTVSQQLKMQQYTVPPSGKCHWIEVPANY